jgi:hypothetical protein
MWSWWDFGVPRKSEVLSEGRDLFQYLLKKKVSRTTLTVRMIELVPPSGALARCG